MLKFGNKSNPKKIRKANKRYRIPDLSAVRNARVCMQTRGRALLSVTHPGQNTRARHCSRGRGTVHAAAVLFIPVVSCDRSEKSPYRLTHNSDFSHILRTCSRLQDLTPRIGITSIGHRSRKNEPFQFSIKFQHTSVFGRGRGSSPQKYFL